MPTKQTRSANGPLQGYRIALTTEKDNPFSPAPALRKLGATVRYYPVAQQLELESYVALDTALNRAKHGDATWLLLATPCAVEALHARMVALKVKPKELNELALAAFGAMTQQAVTKLLPDLRINVAGSDSHAQFIDNLRLTPDDEVIVPVASASRADWAALIEATGAQANVVPAYRLLLGRGGDDVPGELWAGNVDAMLFLTENSVRHFAIRLKAEGGTLDMLHDVAVICLDAATARAARTFGLDVQLTLPDEAADTIAAYLAEHLGVAVANTGQ